MTLLSVDLDLVIAHHTASREEALKTGSEALDRSREELADGGFRYEMGTAECSGTKLSIERSRSRIKVEVNHVFRATVLSVESARDTLEI